MDTDDAAILADAVLQVETAITDMRHGAAMATVLEGGGPGFLMRSGNRDSTPPNGVDIAGRVLTWL